MARPIGSKNKHTLQRDAKLAMAADAIKASLPRAFRGDAHALLIATYANEDNDLALRLDAAKAAIPYEKPRLSSATVDHKGSIDIRAWLLDAK